MPYCTGDNDGEKFLPPNAKAPNPIKAQVGNQRPVTLKKTAKTHRPCSIGIELEVEGWGTGGVEEEGTPVPIAKKNLPHIYVLKELPAKADNYSGSDWGPLWSD